MAQGRGTNTPVPPATSIAGKLAGQAAWHDVWIGAFLTACLFSLGKYLIGLYLIQSTVASGFGPAGSVVAVLLWVYYSARIFLLGAIFTRQYAIHFGSLKGS